MTRAVCLFALMVAGCAADAEVDRSTWAAVVEVQLPTMLCVQPVFATCYAERRPACEARAAVLTRRCIKDENVPLRFPRKAGGKWGGKVGACVGRKLEAELTRKVPEPVGCPPRQ